MPLATANSNRAEDERHTPLLERVSSDSGCKLPGPCHCPLSGQAQDFIRWNEVRREDVEMGTLSSDPECQNWTKQLMAFVTTKLGSKRTVKVHSYILGGNVYLAIDVFNDFNEEYVAISALMCGNAIYLAPPGIRQFDIALPNITDGFYLINALLSSNQVLPEMEQSLYFAQPGRQVA
jgi:hypothetical protein